MVMLRRSTVVLKANTPVLKANTPVQRSSTGRANCETCRVERVLTRIAVLSMSTIVLDEQGHKIENIKL